MISLPALLLTAAWVVLVGVVLMLFGRTAGGAWSIAGGVARGVREWSGRRTDSGRRATSSSWSDSGPSSSALSTSSSPASSADAPSPPSPPVAELEDLGDRPTA